MNWKRRLAGGLLCLALTSQAEETALHKRISVDYRNAPLAEVLGDLAGKSGVRIDAAEALLQHLDLVTCAATGQEAGRVLTRILRPRGLKLEKPGGSPLTVAKLNRLDEFKVKREESFEFAEKPKVTREGDKVTIAFETKGFCDVTVALQDANGEVIRHLASGVLGEHAPEPFQWNSKRQVLLWDCKNNKGEYVADKEAITVRVSLGLKPAYEKPLFWSPHKRFGSYAPILCATPEGVYVSEGYTVDTVRLFDHDGNYVRTVFPFPAGKLDQVVGLEKQTVLQTGQALPRKLGTQQAALLTSGNSCISADHLKFGGGIAATAMAVQGDRIALAYLHLNRLRTDGSSGGLALKGPATGFVIPNGTMMYQQGPFELGPTSAAFSPDGKTVYLTGYVLFNWSGYCRQGVYKIAYEKDTAAEVFAGDMKPDGDGTDHTHFAVPNSVACDAQGRVYVADYLNHRVQIYAPDGKYLKSLSTPLPAKVQIDPRTQEIYVFSWNLGTGISNDLFRKYKLIDPHTQEDTLRKHPPGMTRFGPFDDPKQLGRSELPLNLVGMGQQQSWMGQLLHLEMDFHAKQPTLWLAGRKYQVNQAQIAHLGSGVKGGPAEDAANSGICLAVQDGAKWKRVSSFGEHAQKAVARLKAPDFGTQLLYVNEKSHKLYLLEQIGFNKSNPTLIEIDPQTGQSKPVQMPFDAEDICFDRDGHIYLRTDREVVRYDPQTWREVPWDYGEERKEVIFSIGPRAEALSALPLPGSRPGLWHQGGMWVSPKGHLAVACYNEDATAKERAGKGFKGATPGGAGKPYTPTVYIGRQCIQEVHLWDKHGKLIRADAIPGLGYFNGLGIDCDDNLYVMFQAPRNIGGKPYPNIWQGTAIKFEARDALRGNVQVLSTGGSVPIPMPESAVPKRLSETIAGGWYGSFHGKTWMTGAEWFYGGVGVVGAGCSCYHTRFQMDAFARSFAPEPDAYSVAVLDSSGNLILRIGKYGNTDDGIPLVPHPGIPAPRSLGGDEVPLFYPAYVGVDTDRRLFISDIGSARIVSVKLGYHAQEMVALKDVKATGN